jgi:hypothetical protein
MRPIATIILLIFSFGFGYAQETDTIHSGKSHVFSLHTGFVKYIERDDAMSPFAYRGHSLPVEISYRFTDTIVRHLFYMHFDNLRLRSSLPDYEYAGLNHYVKSTDIQIGYSYLRRAVRFVNFHSDLYLGAEFNSILNLRQHAYIENNEFLMLDQFNSLGFKALLEKRFPNERQVVTVSLNIPVVSYVLMGNTYNAYVGEKTDPLMDYSGNMLMYLAKNGDIVSFNRLVYFKTDVSLVQFISRHIGIECKFSLRYYRFCQYHDLNYSRNLQNQLIIGIVGKL